MNRKQRKALEIYRKHNPFVSYILAFPPTRPKRDPIPDKRFRRELRADGYSWREYCERECMEASNYGLFAWE